MATGFCPYLLEHIGEVTQSANPMWKVQPPGLLNMLLTAGNPLAVKYDQGDGHRRDVQVKYRAPFTVAQTDTSLSCDQILTPAYTETSVTVGNTRQIAFVIPDSTMERYCSDASNSVTLGKPATSFMNEEIMGTIMSSANALLQAVTQDIWALLTWGFNLVFGSNAVCPINLPQNATTQTLNEGMTKILSDYGKTYLTGRPQIVGSGLIYNYFLQQFAKSTDTFGLNSKIMAGQTDFYFDNYAETSLGTNRFAVFEPGSIQIVKMLHYRGFQAGARPGGSFFATLPLPIQVADQVVPYEVDMQLRYVDCPTTFTDAYSGATSTVTKGWQVILSTNFGLFQIPTFDAYRVDDSRYRVNGALRYAATNN